MGPKNFAPVSLTVQKLWHFFAGTDRRTDGQTDTRTDTRMDTHWGQYITLFLHKNKLVRDLLKTDIDFMD